MGTVTVEGTGIANVLVTIQGNGEEEKATTNAAGQYSVTDLPAGEYSVGISGFDDDEYGFDVTTSTVTVELKETATVPFEGIMLRTAGIEGTVTVEGQALPGVTVTVSGKGEEHTRVTNAAGYYMVDKLHAGDYAVAISNFDANEYEFPSGTTTTITVALRKTETVAFQGDLLRTAGISGRVSVEGTGLDGVMVTMSGDADATAMTADGGQYAFTGLAEGDYKVAIEGWDAEAYSFEMTEATLPVGDGAAVVQNFDGMHTRTASVSGKLFLDEVDGDGMYTAGEPAFAQAGIPLLLQGPGVSDVKPGMSMDDGSYAFDSLRAGAYRVLINMSDTVAAGLTKAGYRFSGELTGAVVSAAAGKAAMVNFPFRIVMQTILAGAVMGKDTITGDVVGGVELAMFPTAEDADDDTNMLGEATTDSTGQAKFDFPRMADLGPGGQGLDHLVFVKVTGTGHKNLVVSDNPIIEIEYEATDRVSGATTAVRLLNLGVNFRWSVKSNADAKDGNEFLPHWKAVMGTDTIATNAAGLASYSGTLESAASLPDSFTVMLDTIQVDTLTHQGEKWVQTKALTFVHDGMTLPAKDTANNLGPIYVTFTTQTLVLGIYREADDEPGFSDYRSGLPRGDHRPHPAVASEMSVELMVRDTRNRLRRFEWDHDDDPMTDDKEAMGPVGSDGMFRMARLPDSVKLTARYRAGPLRMLVSDYADIETFGDDLKEGSSQGAFGREESGAVPQVRVCPLSEGTDDEECATYGYQWTTGGVSGTVGSNSGHVVGLAMTTDAHGADDDDAESGKDGAFSFGGLRDGEYDITASPINDYDIVGKPTQEMVVYHDEFVDDKDTTTKYVGTAARDTATWSTKQVGLAIMGYVGNDSDKNRLFRGDEAIEGVTLQLMTGVLTSTTTGAYYGGKVVATATTNARGFYSFDDLDAGSYQVRAVSTDTYWAVRSFDPNYNYSGPVGPAEYPTPGSGNFVEGEFNLPSWEYKLEQTEWPNSPVTDDKGTEDDTEDDVSAVLRNFALVWADGVISGKVDNISGSSGGIDVRVYQCRDVAEANDDCGRGNPIGYTSPIKTTTTASGGFQFSGLTEGDYQVEIEDIGWTPPLLRSGKPDDDAAADGADAETADTMFVPYLEGREAHSATGTFYVYDSGVSDNDVLGSGTLAVRGYMHGEGGATYGDTTGNVPLRFNRTSDTETTDDVQSPLMTISWESETIRFVRTVDTVSPIPEGADLEIEMAKGECSGYTCKVRFNATGSGETDNFTDTVSLTMTAANGYDDHLYRVTVARQNPMDHTLGLASITVERGTLGDGDDGSQTDPYVITTTDSTVSSVTVHFNLGQYGTRGARNQYCAQSLVVEEANDEEVDANTAEPDDVCENERYTLPVADGAYKLNVTSEDDKTRVYHLVVQRP